MLQKCKLTNLNYGRPFRALTYRSQFVCVWRVHTAPLYSCTQLGNGTGRRTVTMMAPLLLTSGLVRHEAVLHSCGTSPVGGGGVGSAHSWQLNSAASLRHQAVGSVT